ncbi:MAG: 3-hydroxyacyl-[acyl-carrier-protein] dehydratase [Cyclobacteriaceae bacterium]|jgi:3-hydroxyacyl-[acyl-carrier-protein] dehydratase
MNLTEEIISKLPYQKPFHFVEQLESIDENGSVGTYSLKKDEYFYEGHFPGNPVTPGVIVIEIMAQIGLVCLGIFLEMDKSNNSDNFVPFFSSTNVDFLKPSYPGDVLRISSKKVYYRFGKLKCTIECHNLTSEELVCRGEFSGMIIKKGNIEK